MLKNYLKIAFRNLTKNKLYSLLNITSLPAGMAVTLLIGLWINDELFFDKYHQNYSSIAQVLPNRTLNGEVGTQPTMPMGNNHFIKTGSYMEAGAPSLFSLKMISGAGNGLQEPYSIVTHKYSFIQSEKAGHWG